MFKQSEEVVFGRTTAGQTFHFNGGSRSQSQWIRCSREPISECSGSYPWAALLFLVRKP